MNEKDTIIRKMNSKLFSVGFHRRDTKTPERRFGCLESVDPKLNLDLFLLESFFQLAGVVVDERTFWHDGVV